MSVSLPGCHHFDVADIVRITASSGYNVAAANIEDIKTTRYQGQEGLCSPASQFTSSPYHTDAVLSSLLTFQPTTAPYHRAGALFQRRNCRQQAGVFASLSDVLFILIKENSSILTTSHY
jgi:hypothetical protein